VLKCMVSEHSECRIGHLEPGCLKCSIEETAMKFSAELDNICILRRIRDVLECETSKVDDEGVGPIFIEQIGNMIVILWQASIEKVPFSIVQKTRAVTIPSFPWIWIAWFINQW
jgi:hypothetical protein